MNKDNTQQTGSDLSGKQNSSDSSVKCMLQNIKRSTSAKKKMDRESLKYGNNPFRAGNDPSFAAYPDYYCYKTFPDCDNYRKACNPVAILIEHDESYIETELCIRDFVKLPSADEYKYCIYVDENLRHNP